MTSLVLQGGLPMRIIGLPAAPSLSYRIRTGYKERPRRRRLLQLEMISGGANGQTFPVARKFSTVKTRSARRGLTLGVFVLIRLRDEEHRQNNGIQKKDRITGLTGFGPVVVFTLSRISELILCRSTAALVGQSSYPVKRNRRYGPGDPSE